jgi:LysR family transcriptional regulator, low CO2-responsive transcriptional regulator
MFHLTLRQLQIFEAVARHLSYSRAADELHLTQPAVSMQVKQLEENLGLALFEQLGKKVHLTEAGEELHRHSREIMLRVKDAMGSLEVLKGVDRGRLNIAAVSTAKYFAPQLLATFCRRYPDVQLSLAVHNREEVWQMLADNACDLAIMGRPPDGLDAVAHAFAYHPHVIIAAPRHRLAKAKQIPLVEIARETFVVRESGSGTRSAMERLFAAHRLQINPSLQMASNETIKQAVMAGMGISFLSLHTVGLELEAERLVVLDVEGLPVMRRWYLAHREGKRLSPTAQAFKEFLIVEGAQFFERAPFVVTPEKTPRKTKKTAQAVAKGARAPTDAIR